MATVHHSRRHGPTRTAFFLLHPLPQCSSGWTFSAAAMLATSSPCRRRGRSRMTPCSSCQTRSHDHRPPQSPWSNTNCIFPPLSSASMLLRTNFLCDGDASNYFAMMLARTLTRDSVLIMPDAAPRSSSITVVRHSVLSISVSS